MTDQEKREKVIKGLEVCADMNEKNKAEIGCSHNGCKNCNIGECVCYPEFIREVIVLLKAQEPRVMTDAKLLDAIRKAPIIERPAVDAVPVVRCKDCKHRPVWINESEMGGFGLEFPDNKCPCQCDDGYYSWMPNDDWYCADGERRDEDAAD